MMEAIRRSRNLRSVATRAGLLQLRRPVSTQSPRPLAVKENADTTMISSEEASSLGASKKPPGSNPGNFMHQQSSLNTKNNKYFQPWLLPIYPMAGMVAIGVGLALMTAYRELAVNPGVLLDKEKRTDEALELDDKEWALQMSRKYAENSPLRKLSKEKISPFGRHLDKDTEESTPVLDAKKAISSTMNPPPVLPGDDKSVHGPEGLERHASGQLLGIWKQFLYIKLQEFYNNGISAFGQKIATLKPVFTLSCWQTAASAHDAGLRKKLHED